MGNFMKLVRLLLAGLVLLVVACGSGGGGSQAGSFTLSASSASFSAQPNGPLPPTQTVHLHLTSSGAVYVGAGYKNGQQQPSWLNVSITGGGSDYDVTLSIISTAYPIENLAVVLSIGTADAGGNILETQDISVSYSLTNRLAFASAPLASTLVLGSEPSSATQAIGVSGQNIQYTVNSSAPWLKVPTAAQSAPGNFTVTLDDSGLAQGQYQATLKITNVGNAADNATLSVTLTVRAPILSFSSFPVNASLTLGSSQATATQSLMVTGDSSSFTVRSNAAWLKVPSGAFNSPGSFNATLDETGLDIGTYQGVVTITDTYDADVSSTLNVTLVVAAPVITLAPVSIVLGGQNGLDGNAVPIALSVNTGTNSYPWSAVLSTASGGNWLVASSTQGSFNQNSSSVSLSANRASLKGGTYTGQVKVQATVQGYAISASLPVTLNWAGNRLLASSDGVAFSSFPSHKLLTRTLAVSSTSGSTSTAWKASSNQPWLSVTASGTTGGKLTLTANPTGLAPDQFHLAIVTVSSTDAAVENQEVIRVGLWAGGTDPQSVSTNVAAYEIETDPVEPYAFTNNGGTDITVYNVYSGAVVGTFKGVANQLGRMVSSSDGATLFVQDVSAYKIYAIDVETGKVGSTVYEPTNGIAGGPGLLYARPQGHSVLIVANGNIYDVQNGMILSDANAATISGDTLAASADGLHVYSLDTGLSPSDLNQYNIGYSELKGGSLVVSKINGTSPGSNGGQVAVSSDGSRIYVSDGYPYVFDVLDGTDLRQITTLQGDAYPDSAVVAWNDVFLGGINGYYNATDIFVYDPTGKALGAIKSGPGSLRNHGVRISGDGWRAVATTDNPALSFQAIPGQ